MVTEIITIHFQKFDEISISEIGPSIKNITFPHK